MVLDLASGVDTCGDRGDKHEDGDENENIDKQI